VSWFVPGRIEVLGKHTDYAGGRVLVCATEAGITVTATPGGRGIRALSAAVPDPVTLGPDSRDALPAGHWGRYLATAVDRLTANFGELAPAELRFSSDLPLASGMSSSSALIVASALAMADLNGLRESPAWQASIGDDLQLAGYLASVENGQSFGGLQGHAGVGTNGGSEDHVAMLCSRPDELRMFEFFPPRELGSVALPAEWTFVVAVSGIRAEKTGAARDAYNRAADATAALLSHWNSVTRRRDVSLAGAVRAGLGSHFQGLDRVRASRLHQFIEESEHILPDALDALAAHNFGLFGSLVDESQRLATEALGNQIPQTIDLQQRARRLGAEAASAFGAGFGGSVWALVRTEGADDFAAAWLADHRTRFDATAADVLISRPAAGARRIA